MKKSKVIFTLLLLCLLLATLLRRCSSTPASTNKESTERATLPIVPPGINATKNVVSNSPTSIPSVGLVYATPIVFYGKVQTQEGVPIADAHVNANIANKFGGSSLKMTTQSDSQGNFSISSMGMTIVLQVSKDGYFHIPETTAEAPRSGGAFDYGADLGKGIHRPDQSAPVIFTLFKPLPLEPLNRIREKETVMPKNGEPVRIALDVPTHILELKCWTSNANKERDGRHDWKLEISVVEGSIQRRNDNFDFIAPTDGYEQTDLIHMPRTLKRPDWQDDLEQSYWLRFNDGTYGSVKVRMIAGGAHYSIVSGHVNPKPGSRNLTINPSKRK